MLCRKVRLRSGRDFRAVYGKCRTVSSPRLVLAVRQWKNSRPESSRLEHPYVRFGFSISKKTAKRAHDRNRIKRRLREIVRNRIIPRLKPAIDSDTIITVRQPALILAFEDLATDVETLFTEAGLVTGEI